MSKKNLIRIIIIGLFLAFIFSACSTQQEVRGARDGQPVVHTGNNDEKNYGNQGQGFEAHAENSENGSGYYQSTDIDLSEEEIADLLFMREEEKLARDVYAYLYTQWNLPVFQSIAQSEQNHMDSILELLDAYGLEDPVAQTASGEFVNSDLQGLYDSLIARGEQSLEDALRVGALIEEVDILDLVDAIEHTDKADIERVYSNLLFGSENHLRSFTSQLSRHVGVTYEPVQLDQETYQGIIADQAGQRGRPNN